MGSIRPAGRITVEWSAPMAYVVGLIATDGCLSGDGRHIDFTSKDVDLIETFKKCLGLNNQIGIKQGGFGTTVYRIQFSDVKLYKWLQEIGLTSDKTKIISELDIPDEWFFDFLRGHLDGDGNIRVYQDPIYPNSQRLYTKFSSASLAHLEWLRESIWRMLNISGQIRSRTRVYKLVYAKRASVILLQAMYHDPNVPCLERKRRLVESFL
jgi:hypothetical protein